MNKLNLKHLFILLFLIVASFCNAKDKTLVWSNPTSACNYGYFTVTRVEFRPDETVLDIHYKGYSSSILFVPETYLLADGKRYAVTKAEGLTLGEWLKLDDIYEKDFVFHFEPLPSDTKCFELHEGDGERAFVIRGISTFEWMANKVANQLLPSAWRNEQTGDFEIAFSDNYVVYDCKFWQYKNRDDKKGRFVVTNGKDEMTLNVGKNKAGKRQISINGAKPDSYSCIATKYLPDYPVKDENPHFNNNGFRPDSVTIVGCIDGVSDNSRTVDLYFADILRVFDYPSVKVRVDSLGRFRYSFLLKDGLITMCIDSHSFIVEPGETYLYYENPELGQHLMMGKNARFQNEMQLYGLSSFGYREINERKDSTLEQMKDRIEAVKVLYDEKRRECDSLFAAHPYLSMRFRRYLSNSALFSCGTVLKNCLDDGCIADAEKFMLRYLTDNILSKRQDDMYVDTQMYFVRQLLGEAMFELYCPQSFIIESCDEKEAANEFLMKTALIPIKTTADSLCTDSVLRSMFVSASLYLMLEENMEPLTDFALQLLNDYVTIPVFKEKVVALNEEVKRKYNAGEREINESKVYVKPEELEGITDGKALLEKIVEPFKGKIVMLDLWGTWCGPCKDAIRESHTIKEQLKDYDMVYIYLANNSPEKQWKKFINTCGVIGENCVHYNLPVRQQNAIERYLQIRSFPTYRLFDKDGNLVEDDVDGRELESILPVIKRINK
ncbi:MAG: TlpA family protein disulfide reductase [Bacteroidaceae bacterium]|nr:TlpA family protein disulfide reductase [Bacteroidaceae bacterium]